MSDNNEHIITIDDKPYSYFFPSEKVLQCIKQSLREKGKFYWGDNATWKRAMLCKTKNFGSYCLECEDTLDNMIAAAIYGVTPFYLFGNKDKPYKASTLVKIMLPVERTFPTTKLQDENEWKSAQMIAYHVVLKTNAPYRLESAGKECFAAGEEQDFRIVHSWWYRKKAMVKTVYGNVYETNAKHRLPYVFKGTFDETETFILVNEDSIPKK